MFLLVTVGHKSLTDIMEYGVLQHYQKWMLCHCFPEIILLLNFSIDIHASLEPEQLQTRRRLIKLKVCYNILNNYSCIPPTVIDLMPKPIPIDTLFSLMLYPSGTTYHLMYLTALLPCPLRQESLLCTFSFVSTFVFCIFLLFYTPYLEYMPLSL